MAFSIASLNINGGRSSIRKAEVKQFVETNHIDVLLLQETRCSSSCASEWQRIMRGKWFFSSLEHPRAGVAVYIQPSFCSPSVVFNEIIKGYLISLTFTHNGFKHTVLNVYAPSDSTERLAFYTHLETSLVHIDFVGLVCLGGDFNCTMDPAIDRNGEEPHPASAAPLLKALSKFSLVDVWRIRNLSVRQYTWSRCSKGHLSLARLDRFYINSTFLNVVFVFTNQFGIVVLPTGPSTQAFWMTNCLLMPLVCSGEPCSNVNLPSPALENGGTTSKCK